MVVPEKPNNEEIVATGCYLTLPPSRGGFRFLERMSDFSRGGSGGAGLAQQGQSIYIQKVGEPAVS